MMRMETRAGIRSGDAGVGSTSVATVSERRSELVRGVAGGGGWTVLGRTHARTGTL